MSVASPESRPLNPVVEETLADPRVIDFETGLIRLAMHPNTHFEEGAKQEIRDHRDTGGAFYLLVTHFRRWEVPLIGQVVPANEPLEHMKYTTGITARQELLDLPVLGPLIKRSGVRAVRRTTENAEETPEERRVRQEENQKTQEVAGAFLEEGFNWITYVEGSSRENVIINGEKVRVPRRRGVVLPIRKGFAVSLQSMSEEARKNVRLIAMCADYGEGGLLSSLVPSVHISRPESPVEGTIDEMVQQVDDMFRRGVAEAIKLRTQWRKDLSRRFRV